MKTFCCNQREIEVRMRVFLTRRAHRSHRQSEYFRALRTWQRRRQRRLRDGPWSCRRRCEQRDRGTLSEHEYRSINVKKGHPLHLQWMGANGTIVMRVLTGKTGKEAVLLSIHERRADNGGAWEDAADKFLTLGLQWSKQEESVVV